MAIKKADFRAIFLDESPQIYADIFRVNEDEFNHWVTENFHEIITINSYDEVVPSEEVINYFLNLGYTHVEQQCHYSAKAISLLDEKFEYITGFIHRQDYPHNIVTHSFNIFDNSVIDFSRLDEDLNTIEVEKDFLGNYIDSFPHVYYGIEIPKEFVENFRRETFEENSMNPLLYEWYIEFNS